jgi:hypothetical protein
MGYILYKDSGICLPHSRQKPQSAGLNAVQEPGVGAS